MVMNVITRISLLIAVVAVSACTTPFDSKVTLDASEITPVMLLDASPLMKGVEPEELSRSEVLAVTPGMEDYLDSFINERMGENTKLRHLLLALMNGEDFELVYDDQTRTAAATFEDQHGNCLSFTNMSVAMARQVGLNASYQEVEIPPDWSTAGSTLLLSQHVNVFVDLAGFTDRVIDFNTQVVHFQIHDLKPTYKRTVISDERALAHYFNNIGVEHMLLGGDSRAAFANFRQGILEDETFAPAWISLGILHRREGYMDYAEAAYLQALKVDPYSEVAMSNLASLYELQGKHQLSMAYREQVESHRMQNPYYRYELANEAFVNGDYNNAIDHLEFAIRKQEHESEFYALMSLNYLMLGQRAKAQQLMKQAEEAAREGADKQRYHRKLELMMGNSSKP
jgi:Tfp pilus assembly protein PilF